MEFERFAGMRSAQQGAPRGLPRLLSAGLRIGITAVLLGFLLTKVDLGRLATIFKSSSLLDLCASSLALAATAPVNAVRWRVVLGGKQAPGAATLFKILFVGMFFNQVLPTGIGGDVVRAWRCTRLGLRLAIAVKSILLDRACGFLMMVLLYAASMRPLLAVTHDRLQRQTLVAVLLATLFGMGLLFVFDRLPRVLMRHRLIGPLAELSRDARRLFGHPNSALAVVSLSAISTFLTIYSVYLAGQAVGIGLPFYVWVLIVPPVTLIQLVPLSLAGWGVREAALVAMLAVYGIPAETALAASLAFGICQAVTSLPGGLVWISDWDIA